MSVLTFVFGGFVFAYAVAYAVNVIRYISRFSRCKAGEEMKEVQGYVCEKVGEENRALNGVMVNLCFPKYEYDVNGEKKYLQSTVKFRDVTVGQPVEIGYCERTGEAWAIQDVPLMKRNLIVREAIVLALLIALALTEILL